MRITRGFLILASAPALLSAQVAIPPVPARLPDLAWIAPLVADAQGRAQAALASVAPAMARARAGLIRAQAMAAPAMTLAGPALAQAQIGLRHAQAALAVSGARLAMSGWGDAFSPLTSHRAPPEPWAQQDPADQLYRDARAALNRTRYSDAAELFRQIYSKYPRSSYAGDAYYWQAYALSKRDSDQALRRALEVLQEQKDKAPRASTRRDADALATRIRGQLARGGDAGSAAVIASEATAAAPPLPPMPAIAAVPAAPRPPAITGRRAGTRDRCNSEDDIQTAALNALQQMDTERALPILKRVLARRDDESTCLRRKAMFIVSQLEGKESEQILLDAARSDPDPEVREQAVFWLSQVDSPTAVIALDSILRTASDPVLQDKAIFALSQQDAPKARQALRDFALRSGVSDELREKAIFWIGQSDDPDRLSFLKTLYAQLKSAALRDKILFSISQIDGRESSQWLLQVAGDVNEDIELRKKALFWVGQSDYPISELTTLYDRMPSREMKEQLIFVYSQRNEKAAVDRMIQIAKTEPDRELKKKAIFWLSQSNDPRVAEFLASLLEKP